MTLTISDWIQVLVVVTAIGASLAALRIASKDRKNAIKIAEDDRAAAAKLAEQGQRDALKQAHMIFELETLTRLLENLNRGGSSDRDESSRMGAEALTLIGVLGRDRVPHLWDERAGTDEKLRKHYADPEMPQYKKDAIEVQLAVSALHREIQGRIATKDSTTA